MAAGPSPTWVVTENQCAYLLTLQRVFGHPLTSGIVQAHTNSHLVLIILLTISSCFYKNMRYLQVSTNYPTVYFPPLAPGRPSSAAWYAWINGTTPYTAPPLLAPEAHRCHWEPLLAMARVSPHRMRRTPAGAIDTRSPPA